MVGRSLSLPHPASFDSILSRLAMIRARTAGLQRIAGHRLWAAGATGAGRGQRTGLGSAGDTDAAAGGRDQRTFGFAPHLPTRCEADPAKTLQKISRRDCRAVTAGKAGAETASPGPRASLQSNLNERKMCALRSLVQEKEAAALFLRRLLRITPPTIPKPPSIIAHVAGSGTALCTSKL
jgi:hypothetical protein